MKKSVNQESIIEESPSLKEEVILLCIFFIIAIVFFLTLSGIRSDIATFGIKEILFSIAFAFLITAFLIWIRSMSLKHAYLGIGTGIFGVVILGYGYWLRFKGPYSFGFMAITVLTMFSYIGWNFWKFRKQDKYIVGEFDEG